MNDDNELIVAGEDIDEGEAVYVEDGRAYRYIIGAGTLQEPEAVALDNSPSLSQGVTGREPRLGGDKRSFIPLCVELPIDVEWEIFARQFMFRYSEDER